MSYLLDTNIISEIIRPQPNIQIHKWLRTVPFESLFISVLTVGEIRRGIQRLGECSRKSRLIFWLEQELPMWFGKNILSVNQEIAERWGYITSVRGHQQHTIDNLLAATALTLNLKMVTRNVKDFNIPGLELLNPFE